MSTDEANQGDGLAYKIARLVEEKGWNGEDFARISQLNRHTVRQILQSGGAGGDGRRLRNATVGQCAEAFGLTVNELRSLPLDRLLARVHGHPPGSDEARQLLADRATLPEFVTWLERNPDRAAAFRPEEVGELLELQASGGPMERLGVEHFVGLIERRRELLRRVGVIARTEYLAFLEQFVGLVFDKVQRGSDHGDRFRK